MKVVIQRVQRAKVTVDSEIVGEISTGLLLLVGFGKGDTSQSIPAVVDKILNMRIFPNEQGRFDRSLLDIKGEVLAVSQFTLYADTSKGRRPEFFGALDPASAQTLFEEFLETLRNTTPSKVAAGRFGAMMQVELVNDGPVTITLEQ
jgi:D-tyrosyl-tRNA(Tyr) deacylase